MDSTAAESPEPLEPLFVIIWVEWLGYATAMPTVTGDNMKVYLDFGVVHGAN